MNIISYDDSTREYTVEENGITLVIAYPQCVESFDGWGESAAIVYASGFKNMTVDVASDQPVATINNESEEWV